MWLLIYIYIYKENKKQVWGLKKSSACEQSEKCVNGKVVDSKAVAIREVVCSVRIICVKDYIIKSECRLCYSNPLSDLL